MMEVELKPVDIDHFWYGDVLIDLVQLRYQAEQVKGFWPNHQAMQAYLNLRVIARELLKDNPSPVVNAKWAFHCFKQLWEDAEISVGVDLSESKRTS